MTATHADRPAGPARRVTGRVGAWLLLAAIASAAPAGAQAQQCTGAQAVLDVPDPFSLRFDAARLLRLTGAAAPAALMLRRPSAETGTIVCAAAAAPLAWALGPAPTGEPALDWSLSAPSIRHGYNSAYPRNRNNGAVWGGVGSGLAVAAGVRARWRWLDVQVAPEHVWQQNADFEVAPNPVPHLRSAWANPYHRNIDWYQRPGDAPQSALFPGQSHVRLTVGPARAGFATENVWIGTARIYPILMSSTAPGFPHAFLETSAPVRTRIGSFEVNALWGQLGESEWFDHLPENDDRLFTALVAAYSPSWIPGLSVGAARVYHEAMIPGEFSLASAFGAVIDRSFLGSGGGNRPEGNGIAAIFGRWAFPQVGFEVYGEWAREDTPWNMQDVLNEPDWTQAYALGFQQFLGDPAATRAFRWYGELIHLGESPPLRSGRGLVSYYTHATVIQGHTHRGQLLGAWTGPGSDAQTLGLDMLYARGLTGVWLERNRYDEDTYYRRFADRFGETRHDVELTGGIRQLYSLWGVELEGSVAYGARYNRNFIQVHAEDSRQRVERNWAIDLRAQWFPARARPVF